jgi:PAS domain S-box-containing protein
MKKPRLMALLLLPIFAAVFASDRCVNASPRPVLRRLLLPMAIMVILMTSGVWALLWQQHLHQLSGGDAAFTRLLVLGGAAGGVMLALSMSFIYVLLRRTDQGIRAQQLALQESMAYARKLSTAVEQSPVTIVITDTSGAIEYVNPKFTEMTGYTLAEAMGQNPRILKSGEFPPEAYKTLWNTILAGEVWRGEFHNKKKNGQLFWEQASISPIKDAMGIVTSFVAVKEDITGRKLAEAELIESNRHLAEATSRASEMAEKAEMANAAKSEFLANMSHEIRTPMNGVIGMTGLLLDTELNDEQRRYAEIVRASGESLLSLINNILDFSKIEAKKFDLETIDFDLSSLLDDFAAMLAVRAHEKGLELLCAADLNVPTLLRGDPGRLRQILTNLAGNAIKFTQTGEVAIRVSLKEEGGKQGVGCGEQGSQSRGHGTANISFGSEKENETVLLRFSVRDTGIGIPADKICRLFEEFSQVDASTTRKYGGTGLGLAISRQLAELMGGEAGVSSEEGKGSEFWFTVLLGKQAVVEQAESLSPADLRGVRVLIVDDNATNREILTTRLTSYGMRPMEARDGLEAIRDLYQALDDNDPFRCAVIDMQMPGMDGEAVGRAIKVEKRLADTKMVMLTSMGTRGDARRFQEIGFSAYSTKPIQHRELKAVLSQVLTSRDTEPMMQSIATRHTVRETLNHLAGREMLNLFAGRNARILLAEDNITNQQVALGILKKLGLYADAVANGVEALTALETLPYDLVLMDVQMPVMDGLEATEKIRNKEKIMMNDEFGMMKEKEPEKLAAYSSLIIRHSSIPIIAMTAHAMQGDRELCLAAGMNDYITKPVSPQALVEVLDKWLQKDSNE